MGIEPRDKLNVILERVEMNYQATRGQHEKDEWAHVRNMLIDYMESVPRPWWVSYVEKWVQLVSISILASGYVFKSGIRGVEGTYAAAIKSAVKHYATITSILNDEIKVTRRFDTKSLRVYDHDIDQKPESEKSKGRRKR